MGKTATKTQMMATKVSDEARLLLDRLASRLGTKPYTLMQQVCDVLIRYMDDVHNLDPQIAELIRLFDNFKVTTNLVSAEDRKEIVSAIYIMRSRDGRKPGERAVLVTPCPTLDQPDMATYNVQTILDTAVKACFPSMYSRLKRLEKFTDTGSLLETIDYLCSTVKEDEDDLYIRELFSDTNRSEYGKPVEYTKYVRHNRCDFDDKRRGPRKKDEGEQLNLIEDES